MKPREIIQAFDSYLAERSLSLEATIVGETALNLLDVVSRTTKDCDVLDPTLPPEVKSASQAFAGEIRRSGGDLQDDWLNNGPAALVRDLPHGWQGRLQVVFQGEAILLHCLGREDLLRTKLFALCDRGLDLPDCLAMAPTGDELRSLLPWVQEQDANEDWPDHVTATIQDLAQRLGHEL